MKCKWCENDHENEGTGECNRCWELRHRIEQDPEIAFEIMSEVVDSDMIDKYMEKECSEKANQ